jgi:hypothetical protein
MLPVKPDRLGDHPAVMRAHRLQVGRAPLEEFRGQVDELEIACVAVARVPAGVPRDVGDAVLDAPELREWIVSNTA